MTTPSPSVPLADQEELTVPADMTAHDYFVSLGADPALSLGDVQGTSYQGGLDVDMQATIYFTPDAQWAFVAAGYRLWNGNGTPGPRSRSRERMSLPRLRRWLAEYGIVELDHNLARLGLTAPDFPAVGSEMERPGGLTAIQYWQMLGSSRAVWSTPVPNAAGYFISFSVRADGQSVFVAWLEPCQPPVRMRHLPLAELLDLLRQEGLDVVVQCRNSNGEDVADADQGFLIEEVLADVPPTSYETRPVGLFRAGALMGITSVPGTSVR